MDSLISNIQKKFSNTDDKTLLLQDQQMTQQKINKILEQSYNTLICGPSCQKQKISEELKQKYLDAQTNLKTAPNQLEQTKRNYYIYTEGENNYNTKQENDLKLNAEKIETDLTNAFNEELTNANVMNSYLQTSINNSQYTIDLLHKYLKENKELKDQLKEKLTPKKAA